MGATRKVNRVLGSAELHFAGRKRPRCAEGPVHKRQAGKQEESRVWPHATDLCLLQASWASVSSLHLMISKTSSGSKMSQICIKQSKKVRVWLCRLCWVISG